jgi:tight adherence protein B
MPDSIDPIWIFYVCAAGALIAAGDAIYNLATVSTNHRSRLNRRLGKLEAATERQEAVIALRRERGLSELGAAARPFRMLERLLAQSGVTLRPWQICLAAGIASFAAFCAGLMLASIWTASAVALITLGPGPIFVLTISRNRRRAKFTEQFAEAIDILVRSLRAGHPVPVAIKMAAREMPDPAGSEFGMVEDEITYGLDLETAVRNMASRIGQEDLPLFVASIAIQTCSGGNLTEILEGLSAVVRLRGKMRRKIKALSAEGRMSAIILSSTPIVLFFIINWMAPDFYQKNWDHPWIARGLAGAATWMIIGNVMMYRMINFKF